MKKIYLDNAATTDLHPKVLEKMLPYLKESFGNPSSIHSFGRKSRVAIEESRELVADIINADPSEIYFTSGGTESNNFVINGIAKTEFKESGRNLLIHSAGEHKAVINPIDNLLDQGFRKKVIPLNYKFDLDINSLKITDEASLISIVHVNNETGTINNIKSIAKKFPQIYFHSDAVQSFGKFRIDVKELGVHSLSASGHKFHGPKGIGIAYIKSETPMCSLILGGAQERNRRAGTENIPAIVGLAEALNIANENIDTNFKIVSEIREYFISSLRQIDIKNLIINNSSENSPYTLSITFDPEYYNPDSEAMLMFLDINGIAASSGSACSSGTIKPSHVITAAGYNDTYANGTIRFSFSTANTKEEIDYTIDILNSLSKKFRKPQ